MKNVFTVLKLNWRASLAGLAAFLLSVPGFVGAITAWGNHQAINWRELASATALSLLAVGLASAKANNVHSTPAQTQLSAIQNPQIQQAAAVDVKIAQMVPTFPVRSGPPPAGPPKP